jgi:uncharacterized protein
LFFKHKLALVTCHRKTGAMASISLYDVVIPTLTKGLVTFDHILTKAEKYANEKGVDANAVFPGARLIEDQHPLTFQVQNATRSIKTTVDRLTGIESEPFENTETTIEDLHKRIHAALKLLKSVEPQVVNARAEETVEV